MEPMKEYLLLTIMAAVAMAGQTPPAAAAKPTVPGAPATTPAVKPAKIMPSSPPKTASPFDRVLSLVKAKQSDQLIIRFVETSKMKITEDQMFKLVEAGASSSLIDKIYGPGAAAAPAATPAAAAVVEPAKAAKPAVVQAAYNTDLSLVACTVDQATRRRVVAVQEFDFGAVKTAEQAVLNTQAAVGKGMMALAIKRITEAQKYRVVERAELEKIMKEQDRAASTRLKQGTGAKTGQIIGADAILIGTITVFGSDDKNKKVGVGAFTRHIPGVGGALGGLKLGKVENKFVVVVNYRLADAETSEIIATGEARGEALRKGQSFDIGALTGAGGGGASIDMTSSNFLETIAGEATMQSLDKLIAGLNESEQKIPLRFMDASSRIAQINGPKIYISAGTFSGVRKCDRFTVSRIEQEIKDPVTKEVIDLQLRKIGEFIATEVRDKATIGLFEGSEQPKEGDLAEKIKPPDKPESKPDVKAAAK